MDVRFQSERSARASARASSNSLRFFRTERGKPGFLFSISRTKRPSNLSFGLAAKNAASSTAIQKEI